MKHVSLAHGINGNAAFFSLIALLCLLLTLPQGCVRDDGTNVRPPDNGEIDIPIESIDIDRRYLTEGFIGNRLHRVVIVTLRGSGNDADVLSKKGALRSRVTMERSLCAESIPVTRNTRAAILRLIESNGMLRKTEIEHGRYDIYYYDVTRDNIRQYLKNASLEP
jgi:hypothetical protein